MSSHYQTLGVEHDATLEEIKKAYRRKAVLLHPDKGGNQEEFKVLNTAYETLVNPEKKATYDNGGKPQGFDSFFTSDFFSNIFPGMGVVGKTPCLTISHEVTLEELCQRKIKKLRITLKGLCPCFLESQPSADRPHWGGETCKACQGTGQIKIQSNIGFGMIQQVISLCGTCSGIGTITETCGSCSNGEIETHSVFELPLSPTLPNGHKFMFKGQGNREKGKKQEDIQIMISYKNHDLYLIGPDNTLHYRRYISLKEALCGHSFTILHPDSSQVFFERNEVTTPETEVVLSKRGLTPDSDMVIRFNVNYPNSLTDSQKQVLNGIL